MALPLFFIMERNQLKKAEVCFSVLQLLNILHFLYFNNQLSII
jgi:hypothetical protein